MPEHALETVEETSTVARAPTGVLAAPVPSFGSSAQVLALQRAAGNRGVGAALAGGRRSLARCPGPACRCQDDDDSFGVEELALRRAVIARAPEDGPMSKAPPAGGGSTNMSENRDRSTSYPPVPVSDSDARAIVAEAIAKLGPLGATTVPFPSAAVASAESPAPSDVRTLSAWPADRRVLARWPNWNMKMEGGFVGSLQLCYDFCSGDVSIVGWVWAGFGVVGPGIGGESFYGAYVFAEKEWKVGNLGLPTLDCGTCLPQCRGEGEWEGGFGFAGFPTVIKPNENKRLKGGGLELGMLLHPHGCEADLEVIALFDITQYLGPIGRAISVAEDRLNVWAEKYGHKVECGVGIDVSGSVHLCKGANGTTADSAKLCGGGYVGCNIGLPHDKTALPH